jgi:uncharacterized repeat protein (TIGR03803 family)
MRHLRYLVLAFAVSACSAGAPPYAAHTATYGALHATSSYAVVHSFQGPPNDGWVPTGGLVENGGLLYGTTDYGGSATQGECSNGCGTFYSVDPSSSSETVLYSFQGKPNDGALPDSKLVYSNGVFYGATQLGGDGDFGTIFELTPPKHHGGTWTESVLYNFKGPPSDGYEPLQPTVGSGGALYGTTFFGGSGTGCIFKSDGCGTVFELSPPVSGSGAWRERILHSFAGAPDGAAPLAPLLLSRDGAFFGETAYGGVSGQCPYLGGGGCGTIFALRPHGGSQWSERIIHSFNVAGGKPQYDGVLPTAPLLGTDGVLYGTSAYGGGQPGCDLEKGVSGCGTLFTVKQRSRGRWAESILYAFKGGQTDGALPHEISPDGNGGFYALSGGGGTGRCQASTGCGTLLQLVRSMRRKTVWSDQILHSFLGAPSDGDAPAGAIVSYKGTVYGVTGYGGSGPCNFGCGTIYEFTP